MRRDSCNFRFCRDFCLFHGTMTGRKLVYTYPSILLGFIREFPVNVTRCLSTLSSPARRFRSRFRKRKKKENKREKEKRKIKDRWSSNKIIKFPPIKRYGFAPYDFLQMMKILQISNRASWLWINKLELGETNGIV